MTITACKADPPCAPAESLVAGSSLSRIKHKRESAHLVSSPVSWFEKGLGDSQKSPHPTHLGTPARECRIIVVDMAVARRVLRDNPSFGGRLSSLHQQLMIDE